MTHDPIQQFKADRVVLSDEGQLYALAGKVWLTPDLNATPKWFWDDIVEKGKNGKSIRQPRCKDVVYFRDYWRVVTGNPKTPYWQQINKYKQIFPQETRKKMSLAKLKKKDN